MTRAAVEAMVGCKAMVDFVDDIWRQQQTVGAVGCVGWNNMWGVIAVVIVGFSNHGRGLPGRRINAGNSVGELVHGAGEVDSVPARPANIVREDDLVRLGVVHAVCVRCVVVGVAHHDTFD